MEAKPMNGIDDIIRNPGFLPPPVTVKRTVTSTGARITTQIKADDSEDSEEAKPLIGCEPESGVNALASENVRSDCQNGSVKEEVNVKMSLGESLKEMNTNVMSEEECLRAQINEEQPKEPEVVRVKEEPDGRSDCPDGLVKDEVKASTRMSFDEFLKVTNTKVMSEEECLRTQIKEEQPREVVRVKQEPNGVEDKRLVRENVRTDCPDGWVKDEVNASKRMSFDEFLKATDTKVISGEELLTTPVNVERPKEPEAIKVKEEPDVGFEGNRPSVPEKLVSGMSSQEGLLLARYTKSDGESAISHEKKLEPKDSEKAELPNGSRPNVRVKEEPALGAEKKVCVKEQSVGSNFSSKSHNVKKEIDEDRRISSGLVQDGDFPEEPDWFLVGRTIVTALSTTKGRKLADNEIVDFTFPSPHWRHNAQWIVRFSTKRFGEVHLIGLQFSCVV
jgi:DNA repair protein RAD5